MKMFVAGFDPAICNFGIALAKVDIDTLEIEVVDLKLITTERENKKQVRKSSDDVRRARAIYEEVTEYTKDTTIIFAEVPTGSQSASAAKLLGIATGVLACIAGDQLIEVSPTEVKLASVGTKTASKEEMIAWAVAKYPDAPWLKHKVKGEWKYNKANEHLADSCGAITAGVKTDHFKQVAKLYKSLKVH